ncbi:hypothetical protein OIU76_018873, partial [Salix suchowensis]
MKRPSISFSISLDFSGCNSVALADSSFGDLSPFKEASSSATITSFILSIAFANSRLLSKYFTFCVKLNTWSSIELDSLKLSESSFSYKLDSWISGSAKEETSTTSLTFPISPNFL